MPSVSVPASVPVEGTFRIVVVGTSEKSLSGFEIVSVAEDDLYLLSPKYCTVS
jgi:hypothetical protein